MLYLASLSIEDPAALKILMGLGGAILHLYWQSFRCRERHDKTKERLAALENKVAGCPNNECPLMPGGNGSVSYSQTYPNHAQPT